MDISHIKTWFERVAHLDKPTDFAERCAAIEEVGELRQFIAALPSDAAQAPLTDEQIDALAKEHRIYVTKSNETIFHSNNTLKKIRAFARDLLGTSRAYEATVPPDVMAALDRMCTPLDKSVLTGATAKADAHSMKLIRDYVLRIATPREDVPALGLHVERLEALAKHLEAGGETLIGAGMSACYAESIRAILVTDQSSTPVAPAAAAPSNGVIAAAEALIAADRAQALTTEHVNALENAIAIQLGAIHLPYAQPDERAAFLDIVFDGPPSHESGRFVEVEDAEGRSVNAGEWIDRGNGLWALRIVRATASQATEHLDKRAAFEAWAKPRSYDLARCSPVPYAAYKSDLTEGAWSGWLGRDGEQPELRLDKPAQVGAGRFGVNVKWSTVIGAAQRHYEYMQTPEREAERIETATAFAQVVQRASMSQAACDVLAERTRQVSEEGWTPVHDDQHGDHQMSCAAGCYAMYTLAYPAGDPPPAWPWAADWWKPTTHRRNLVKAGALILAEIERIDRAGGTDEAR